MWNVYDSKKPLVNKEDLLKHKADMKIVILGSIKQESDMKILKSFYEQYMGCKNITIPIKNEEDTLLDIDINYINYINDSDIILALQKQDYTYGESVTYEIAISKFLGKHIVFITPEMMTKIRAVYYD